MIVARYSYFKLKFNKSISLLLKGGFQNFCCVLACEWPNHSQLASCSPVKAPDSLFQQQARLNILLGFGIWHSSSFISLDKESKSVKITSQDMMSNVFLLMLNS